MNEINIGLESVKTARNNIKSSLEEKRTGSEL